MQDVFVSTFFFDPSSHCSCREGSAGRTFVRWCCWRFAVLFVVVGGAKTSSSSTGDFGSVGGIYVMW